MYIHCTYLVHFHFLSVMYTCTIHVPISLHFSFSSVTLSVYMYYTCTCTYFNVHVFPSVYMYMCTFVMVACSTTCTYTCSTLANCNYQKPNLNNTHKTYNTKHIYKNLSRTPRMPDLENWGSGLRIFYMYSPRTPSVQPHKTLHNKRTNL